MTKVNPEGAVLTVCETANLLCISRNTAYEAVKKGEIPFIRIGARILIPKIAIEKMLSGERLGITPHNS